MSVLADPSLRDRHGQLQGNDVARLYEAFAQRHGSLELPVVVFGCPDTAVAFGDRDGIVVEDVDGKAAVVEGGGVDEGLEGRARLARRLIGAVVGIAVHVAATDHGQDLSGLRIHGDKGPLHEGAHRVRQL